MSIPPSNALQCPRMKVLAPVVPLHLLWYNHATMNEITSTPKNPQNVKVKTTKRAYNVKPKPIHYRAIRNLVENGGNVSRAMVHAGYSPKTAENPQKLTESRGFQIALQESGLSLDTLNRYLADDLKNKPKNRLGELTLAYKLHGKLRENVTENKTLVLITSGESATRYNLPVDNPQ